MMQGDACYLGIRILNNAGFPVSPEDVVDVEITIGHLVRTWRGEELVWQDGMWFFPMTQEETQEYWPAAVKAQVRIHWANGVVEGKPIYGVRIEESISKEVL